MERELIGVYSHNNMRNTHFKIPNPIHNYFHSWYSPLIQYYLLALLNMLSKKWKESRESEYPENS